MAASPWAFYNEAKKKLGQTTGGIRLDSGTFRMSLHTTAGNPATATLSLMSETTGELAAAGGYVQGGRSIAGVAWTIAGGSVKWDATTDLVFTANGADLTNIRYAVIHKSTTAAGAVTSGPLICYSALSTAQFPVATGNTLTVQFATAGIFTLV